MPTAKQLIENAVKCGSVSEGYHYSTVGGLGEIVELLRTIYDENLESIASGEYFDWSDYDDDDEMPTVSPRAQKAAQQFVKQFYQLIKLGDRLPREAQELPIGEPDW